MNYTHFLILACAVVLAQALYVPESGEPAEASTIPIPPDWGHKWNWEHFKTKYNKKYPDAASEKTREAIWKNNTVLIDSHNKLHHAGNSTFMLGENSYMDMTAKEFAAKFTGLKKKPNDFGTGRPVADFSLHSLRDMPKKVNWTSEGYVTPIKNQQQCGSCWAFSATGSMEGQHFKKTGKLVSLSEQNLVDCSQAEGNFGCEGGLMDYAFNYTVINKGIDTEASYAYTAMDGTCVFNKTNVGATISSWTDVPSGSEADLQKAVATVGPISVGIDASQYTFQLYKSGVYYDPNCSSQFLDHGVLAVGYGTKKKNGKTLDFWLVKNSWGTDWGMDGYIEMSRNKNNNCGIATQASYPVV